MPTGGDAMKPAETTIEVFIIRMWLEPREKKDALPEWRGMIQRVASGEQRYIQDLDDVKAFIAAFLNDGQRSADG